MAYLQSAVTTQRSSNFELLRIVLILMILVLHYFNMGGLLANVKPLSLNYFLSYFLESACIMAVNVFVIITGYFSCCKTKICLSKPIKLYALSMFYGICLSGIILYFTRPVLDKMILKTVVNAIFNRWFVVIYCVLYVLIPFLNKLVRSLTQQELLKLLLINIFLFYVLNTVLLVKTVADNGYGIVNFINLYLVGSYLRLYKPQPVKQYKSAGVFAVCVVITALYSYLPHDNAWAYVSVFNLLSAIALFEWFRALRMPSVKMINQLATYTFSVYIIHECGLFPTILYRNWFGSNLYWNSPYMLLNLGLSVLGIYGICIIIEFIRRCLFTKIWDQPLDKIPYQIHCD